jgi:serine/threonine protein kinase
MDVRNSFMKITNETRINDKLHFGLKFIKKRAYEELFTESEEVVNFWFEILKRYCILTKFRLYYETIKVIGKGNFAKVFLVERKTDRRQFAVKVFSKSLIMSDENERKCLLYEIKMMREVNFYRVLKLVELYEGENYIYCLCELYPGTDLLNAIVKRGSQPEAKALTITLQIVEALNYLHSKRIMHRDIKPENIIFKGTQENIDIGIVDLGFATFEEDYRKLFVRCGTPGYVAPEILNDKDYDCKVDIFSAGVIFYMM